MCKHPSCHIQYAGTVSLLAGNVLVAGGGLRDAAGSQAQFKNPTAVTLAGDGVTLFVADPGNMAIRSVLVDDFSLGECRVDRVDRAICCP